MWIKAKEGLFSVKLFLDVLEGANTVPSPRKLIWNLCIPTKVSFFAWEGWWRTVLILDQLKKRGWGWVLVNRCYFCEEEEENIDHILLLCSMVTEWWTTIFALLGVDWVLPHSLRDFLIGWKGAVWRKRPKKVVMAAPLCLF